MDKQGYVVTLQTPFEGAKNAANLATAGADPLRNGLRLGYGGVESAANHTLEQAKELVEQLWSGRRLKLKPQYEALKELQAQLAQIQEQLAYVDIRQLDSYEIAATPQS